MMKTKIKKPKESEEIAHLKNQLARALADYDNLTKRVERQSEMFGTLAKTHLVTRLLPAIDMLYDASRHLNDQGLVITIQTLEESLKDEGVEKIQPVSGNVFEDHLHEAVEAVNDPQKENGEIVEVVLAGWKLGDTIIRPAKVKVNRKEK